MLKTFLTALLVVSFPFVSVFQITAGEVKKSPKEPSGLFEKMIVSDGEVAMNLDLNRLNGVQNRVRQAGLTKVNFNIEKDAFFTVVVFDNLLRGSLPSSMNIVPTGKYPVPDQLRASYDQLLIESMPFGEHYELVVRDSRSGFKFFNIEGHLADYAPNERTLNINNGRVLVSKEFADSLRRPELAGTVIGNVTIKATMKTIEAVQISEGKADKGSLPAGAGANGTLVNGPDVVVGDVFGLSQFGSSGSRVGLALGTTSCNYGNVDLNWFRLPNNDHPVIPQNLYRMSGGADNQERFEQIGQSQVKHAFTALTQNLCQLGCNGTGGSRLGSGCSDPYSAGLNAGPNLGSKAWINPFTGFYPRGDSSDNPNTHSGHSHNGTSHRILIEGSDLSTQSNVGARYFAEGQYVTPHEFEWCQSNPGECHMYNNVSYREYNVSGVSSPFSFSPVSSTVRQQSAIRAWTGATFVNIEPEPGVDGTGTLAYKVTQTSPGTWHYEYAVYNESLDRAIQMFSVATGSGAVLNNVGFYAPPQHPGSLNDGTFNDAGFSETPWSTSQTASEMTWATETLAQNQNANAIRWGTMYNFRFDSNRPPQMGDATIGFFKTGSPMTVQVQVPSGPAVSIGSISGMVTDASGSPVRGAVVSVSEGGSLGSNVYNVRTNMFGFYRVNGLPAGLSYNVSVNAKEHSFTSQQVDVNDNVTGINFMALP